MRASTVTMLFVLSPLMACGDSPTEMSCAQIAEGLMARAQSVSRTCDTADACMNVGFPQGRDGQPTCGSGIAFLPCPGLAVNAEAWLSDVHVAPLFEEWQARCVPQGWSSDAPRGAWDCAPMGVDCISQQCEMANFGCLAPYARVD